MIIRELCKVCFTYKVNNIAQTYLAQTESASYLHGCLLSSKRGLVHILCLRGSFSIRICGSYRTYNVFAFIYNSKL